MTGTLNGKRILLLEDEALIAMMAEDLLRDLGAEVVGPALRLSQGLDLAGREELDAAVLDVNIRGETSLSVAETLESRGVPFLFATGYGKDPRRPGTADALILKKPYTSEGLSRALTRLIANGGAGSNGKGP